MTTPSLLSPRIVETAEISTYGRYYENGWNYYKVLIHEWVKYLYKIRVNRGKIQENSITLL